MAGPISFGAQCIRQYPQRNEHVDGVRLVDRLDFRAIKMAGYTGFSMAAALYFLNEALGRPVLKIAAPVVAVIITGILLNIFGWIGLFVPQ